MVFPSVLEPKMKTGLLDENYQNIHPGWSLKISLGIDFKIFLPGLAVFCRKQCKTVMTDVRE